VIINKVIHNEIGNGLLILLGIENQDNSEDIDWVIRKISMMRIFDDDNGVMNKSLIDIQGEILVISQFTLYASTKKGNRPSYIKAAKHEIAIPLYEQFIQTFATQNGITTKSGIFGADMKVHLINDGPVTIFLDSKNKE
jgi:D-tyrosyl-tRNA(Tyr) deacylase